MSKRTQTPTMQIVTITPEMAKKWLGNNTENRGLSKATIAAYARDMAQSRWIADGSPIRFNGDGLMLDGQHRLHACIEAGVPFQSFVVFGLPTDVRRTIDTGRPRRISDYLRIQGLPQSNRLGTVVANLWRIKQGRVEGRVTISESLEILERHKNLLEWVRISDHNLGITGVSPGILAAVSYLGGELLGEDQKARSFVDVFRTGIPAYKGDAAHALRERTIKGRMSGPHYALRQRSQLWAVIHAWNLFRKRTRMDKFPLPTRPIAMDGLDVSRI
ncbi:MAG: hypothetical protein ACM31O_04520 [Bacteroidota bacterium]